MLESAVLTWPWVCCASNCTLLAVLPCFFRSRYVRPATLLSISQTRKWFPSLWSLKSKSPMISTWLSKESAFPGVFVDFSVARGELPPPRYGCWSMAACASPRGIKLSLRTAAGRSNSVSFHFTQTFPEKSVSSLIMPSSRAFFNVRNRAFPTSDCRIVDRSMDPEVLTAKGQVPHDEACRIAAHVDSFRSTPPRLRPPA